MGGISPQYCNNCFEPIFVIQQMNPSILYRIKNQYHQVDDLLYEVSQHFMCHRHKPGKWSIQENLAHLGRYHEVFNERLALILIDTTPIFERYKAEEDPLFRSWLKLPVKQITAETKNYRKVLSEKVCKLDNQQAKRIGIHPKLGRLEVIDWIEFFLLHEAHHFYTIFWLLKEFKN